MSFLKEHHEDFLVLAKGTTYSFWKKEFDPKVYAECNYVGPRTLIKCKNIRKRTQLQKSNGICEEHTFFSAHLKNKFDRENERMRYETGKKRKYEENIRLGDNVWEEDPLLEPMNKWKVTCEDVVPCIHDDHPLKNAEVYTLKELHQLRIQSIDQVIESVKLSREILVEQARRTVQGYQESAPTVRQGVKLDEKQQRLLEASHRIVENDRCRTRSSDVRKRLERKGRDVCTFGRIDERPSTEDIRMRNTGSDANVTLEDPITTIVEDMIDTVCSDGMDVQRLVDQLTDTVAEITDRKLSNNSSILCSHFSLPNSIFCVEHIVFDKSQQLYIKCSVCDCVALDFGDGKCTRHRVVRRSLTPPLILGPLSVSVEEQKREQTDRQIEENNGKEEKKTEEQIMEESTKMNEPIIRQILIDSSDEEEDSSSIADVSSTLSSPLVSSSSFVGYRPMVRELHPNEEQFLKHEEKSMVCARTRPFVQANFNSLKKAGLFSGTVRQKRPMHEIMAEKKSTSRTYNRRTGPPSSSSRSTGFFAGSAFEPTIPFNEDQSAVAGIEDELRDCESTTEEIMDDASPFERSHPQRGRRGMKTRIGHTGTRLPIAPPNTTVRALVGSGVRVAVRGGMGGSSMTTNRRDIQQSNQSQVSGFRGLTVSRPLPPPPHRQKMGVSSDIPPPLPPSSLVPSSSSFSSPHSVPSLTGPPVVIPQHGVHQQIKDNSQSNKGALPVETTSSASNQRTWNRTIPNSTMINQQGTTGTNAPLLVCRTNSNGQPITSTQQSMTSDTEVHPQPSFPGQRLSNQPHPPRPFRYVVATSAQKEAAGIQMARERRGSMNMGTLLPSDPPPTQLIPSSPSHPSRPSISPSSPSPSHSLHSSPQSSRPPLQVSSQPWVTRSSHPPLSSSSSSSRNQGVPSILSDPSIRNISQPSRVPSQAMRQGDNTSGRNSWMAPPSRINATNAGGSTMTLAGTSSTRVRIGPASMGPGAPTTLRGAAHLLVAPPRPTAVPPHRLLKAQSQASPLPPPPTPPSSLLPPPMPSSSSYGSNDSSMNHNRSQSTSQESASSVPPSQMAATNIVRETPPTSTLVNPSPSIEMDNQMDALSLLASAALSQSHDNDHKRSTVESSLPSSASSQQNTSSQNSRSENLFPSAEDRAAQVAALVDNLGEDEYEEEL